jgi:hypothetical protein
MVGFLVDILDVILYSYGIKAHKKLEFELDHFFKMVFGFSANNSLFVFSGFAK